MSAAGCAATSHPTTAAQFNKGVPSTATAAFEAALDGAGPVEVTTVTSATWAVPRSGLINLDHPHAVAQGLEDGSEPVGIYFHALRHPTRGLFIIDTGVETRFRDAPSDVPLSWLVRSVMGTDTIEVVQPLADYLARQPDPLRGVFMTHLHLDHILGMADVPPGVPVYTGRGEAAQTDFLHLFSQGSIDRTLQDRNALRELELGSAGDTGFDGLLDVFGDGSLWAIGVPGHTAGSLAFLARTPDGPVLFVGDASHTRWGWDNGVEPGTFSVEPERSAQSLASLRGLVKRHPSISVRLGHQD